MARYNFKALLQAILRDPSYATWREKSAGHWRDPKDDNAAEVLSEKGLFDHKTGASVTLIALARKLNINLREFDYDRRDERKNSGANTGNRRPAGPDGRDQAKTQSKDGKRSSLGHDAGVSSVTERARESSEDYFSQEPNASAQVEPGGRDETSDQLPTVSKTVQVSSGGAQYEDGTPDSSDGSEFGTVHDEPATVEGADADGREGNSGRGSISVQQARPVVASNASAPRQYADSGAEQRAVDSGVEAGADQQNKTTDNIRKDSGRADAKHDEDSPNSESGSKRTSGVGPKDTTWDDPKSNNSKIAWRIEKGLQLDARSSKVVLKKYLENRGLLITDNIYRQIRPVVTKYRPKNAPEVKFEICIPLLSLEGFIGSLLVIQIDNEARKVRKIVYGQPSYECCISFGCSDCEEVWGFEGFENALAWYMNCKDDRPARCLISCGNQNLKKLKPFYEQFPKRILLLDPDLEPGNGQHAGFRGSLKLEVDGLVKYRPALDMDCNEAVIQGKVVPWLEGLEEITPEKAEQLKDQIKLAPEVTEVDTKGKDQRNITLNAYVTFVRKVYPDVRRDFVTDLLYFKNNSDNIHSWIPIDNALAAVRFNAYADNLYKKKKEEFTWNLPAFEHALEWWRQKSCAPQLLIDIPEWDGKERIREICGKIKPKSLEPEETYQIIREWLARAYLRIYNPNINQHFLILVGAQGRGKDWLIEALTGGYTHYTGNVILENDQTKIERAIYSLVIARVAEFDKANNVSVQILKDVITKPLFTFDQKYVKGLVRAQNRTSFIGSANELNFIRDHTGNRRYRIIEVDDIEIKRDEDGNPTTESNYPGDVYDPVREASRLQILAEAKHWASTEAFQSSSAAIRKMNTLVKKLTPNSWRDMVLDYWFTNIEDWLAGQRDKLAVAPEIGTDKFSWILANGVIAWSDAKPFVDEICRHFGAFCRPQLVLEEFNKQNLREEKYSNYFGTPKNKRKIVYKIRRTDTSAEKQELDEAFEL